MSEITLNHIFSKYIIEMCGLSGNTCPESVSVSQS